MMIEVDKVTKRYGRTLALDEVSLRVEEGELYALLGPNGAGKTTLVHIMTTIQLPDAGVVRIGGVNVVKEPRRARRGMGVVFQEASLDDRLTVFENLDFHGQIFGVAAGERRTRIADMLELVDLSKWRDHLVRQLSTGMKRRLEIARALLHRPRMLFLDEPTAGLDAQTRARIWDHIVDLQRLSPMTVLVTTHYIEEVERCDRICVIDYGKPLAVGTPAELRAKHGQEMLRVQARDEAVLEHIAAHYGERASRHGDELVLASDGPAFVESFLGEYGANIRAVTVETPSLETVFLSLTGREVRDEAAGRRDQLYAFGRRGGEHTR